MKKSIFDLKKLDKDEPTSGDGFVMMDQSDNTDKDKEHSDPLNNDTYKQSSYSTNTNSTSNSNYTPPKTEQINPDGSTYRPYGSEDPKPNYNNGSGGNNGGGTNNPTFNSQSSNNGGYSKNKKRTPIALVIVLALLVGLAGGFGGGYLANNMGTTGSIGGGGSNVTINPNSETNVTEAVAEKVLPSVVGITATTTSISNDMLFGQQSQETGGVGTGIIVDASGYILTNSHVILDRDDSNLTVLLADGREAKGEVEWFDASLDLAIVKITADNLTAAELGNSDDVKIGSYAAAIGNPLGLDFSGSVTQGVVSGLDRSITASKEGEPVRMEDLIQVDAAINSGNSGGPLLNNQGEVIGINTAKASGEGMGFSIPINTAKPIVERIKETGEFNRVYMGVAVRDASEIADEYTHIDLGTKTGAYVQEVTDGSPAGEAGIRAKDVIVEVDGNKVESRSDLINQLLNYKSGDTIKVKYFRGGNERTADVKLTSEAPE